MVNEIDERICAVVVVGGDNEVDEANNTAVGGNETTSAELVTVETNSKLRQIRDSNKDCSRLSIPILLNLAPL